ncbi:MAG: hypothetical protein J5857_01380 [Treponema sp.]|nr:hypothetical protein [Treponema sp.]
MDSIQKLYSDIEKIKKHNRANSASCNGQEVCSQVADLFTRTNRHLECLSRSFAEYWLNTYILNSEDINEEPTQEHVAKLAAFQSLLEGSTDFTECLTQEDWNELCSLTNMEAEDLPIETLNDMMMIFVDRQAL